MQIVLPQMMSYFTILSTKTRYFERRIRIQFFPGRGLTQSQTPTSVGGVFPLPTSNSLPTSLLNSPLLPHYSSKACGPRTPSSKIHVVLHSFFPLYVISEHKFIKVSVNNLSESFKLGSTGTRPPAYAFGVWLEVCTTIGVTSYGHWDTCPLDFQQFNFFSSLQSCLKSDSDLVRLLFFPNICSLYYFVPILYSTNDFHVVLCPPPSHRILAMLLRTILSNSVLSKRT